MSKKGIDVSSYQGGIDWRRVKEDGVEFAILKVIRKDLQPDKQFENNWNGCEAADVPIQGVYNYSYASTLTKAITDAKRVLEVLDGRETMVWLDVEDDCLEGLGMGLIDIINTYAGVITSAGLPFGVYTGEYFYNRYIKPYGGIIYQKWIAKYGKNDGSLNEANKPNVDDITGWQYSSKGKIPGINGNVDLNIWYNDIKDEEMSVEKPEKTVKSRAAVVDKARGFLGAVEGSEAHKEIVDVYNNQKPLARRYTVKYTDSWCATFVSAVSILCGLTDIIPTECSCQKQIDLFEELGTWEESGFISPLAGDLIYYNWDDDTQENNGWADHVGIIEQVSGGIITVIEGNYHDSVKRRQISVGAGNIRGYGRPAYSVSSDVVIRKTNAEIAREVIDGIWGNGEKRKENLQAAGYNYTEVQAMVNSLLDTVKPVYHEVVRGDTLSGIAKLYETTVNAIMQMNSIADKNRIYVGQRIRVQ